MAAFEIIGGTPLKGEITPQGAKNEALQILCAVLLTPEKVTISNVPDIRDVNKLIDLLASMGVKVKKINTDTYEFQADEVNLEYLKTDEFKKQGSSLRGSIMIVGPLLARFGKGYIPAPGGDKIGRRRVDTHFMGFQKFASINIRTYSCLQTQHVKISRRPVLDQFGFVCCGLSLVFEIPQVPVFFGKFSDDFSNDLSKIRIDQSFQAIKANIHMVPAPRICDECLVLKILLEAFNFRNGKTCNSVALQDFNFVIVLVFDFV